MADQHFAIDAFAPNAHRYTRVFIDGHLVYFLDSLNGFRALDISQPAKPAEIGFEGQSGGRPESLPIDAQLREVRRVFGQDNTKSAAERKLKLISLNDPANPILTGDLTKFDKAAALNRHIVLLAQKTLELWRIQDLGALKYSGSMQNSPQGFLDIASDGSELLVVNAAGLYILQPK